LGSAIAARQRNDEPRNKRARTQRTPVRGTAKRLREEYEKPRPAGRVLGRSSLENSRFSNETVAEATQIVFLFGYIRFFGTLTIEPNGVEQGKN
jgi:hypothetical protein